MSSEWKSSCFASMKIVFVVVVLQCFRIVVGYPSPRRERLSDPYEIDDNLAAFFVSLAVVLGICLALVIAVCACCRFDNYLFEVAKRISARCRSYKTLPGDTTSKKGSDESQEHESFASAKSDLPSNGALKHTAYAFADHLKWTDHPKANVLRQESEAEVDPGFKEKVEKSRNMRLSMGDASGDPRRPTDSRMASGCGDSLVSKAVVTRTSSTGRKRPPLLRQLENDVSIMSMTEYQEDGFASAWEARDFLLNPNSLTELAVMSESELDAYRIYFNTEEWEEIKHRWELAFATYGAMEGDTSGTDDCIDDDYQPQRIAAAKRPTAYMATLRTVVSTSESDAPFIQCQGTLSRIESEDLAEKNVEVPQPSTISTSLNTMPGRQILAGHASDVHAAELLVKDK